ncbi:MAG: Holliday junction branch migration protein RuvA [Candidatus Paceibacterota bacterium]
MISHLEGKTIYKDVRFVIISTNGVGYKVFATEETVDSLHENKQVSLWTHLVVKDDALDLYGFPNKSELDFFEKLITISGIGPKTALGVLNNASVPSIKKAITTGDTTHLIKVSGVSKKIAEKIVLELKGKFDNENNDVSFKEEVEALEALKSLGYSHKEAREALKEVSEKFSGTGDRIKQALKILGK